MTEKVERLPYEELDPCCQREIDENTKYNAVSRILRDQDRTYKREDLKVKAFKNLNNINRCGCCSESRDYPILAKLRALAMKPEPLDNNNDDDEEVNDSEDEESDIDSDFLTPFEIERMNQMKAQIQRIEEAKLMGFSTHVEDSLQHIGQDLKNTNTPIVLHLYDASSSLCAQLDLSLEKLAQQYIGTKFRRLPFNIDLLDQPNSILPEIDTVLRNIHTSSTHHALICFVNKSVAAHSTTFTEFSDPSSDDIFTSDLVKYLDNAHVLSSSVSLQDMKYFGGYGESNDEDDEKSSNKEKNSYCDDPDCTRYFPHEHIGITNNINNSRSDGVGGSSAGYQYGTASFMRVKQTGEEALAENVFRTV